MAKAIPIKKVVIPVAGLGTRFFPITKSIPKEMLPIVDKPCIQYLVEEAINSGIKEIIFVTSQDKPSIKEYFSPVSAKLKKLLTEKSKIAELKELQRIEKMAKFSYVHQDRPLGDGHAILCAKKYIKNEPFAVLFGDDIYDSNPPALKQLLNEYYKYNSPIIALEKIDKKDSKKYGMIEVKSKKGALVEINGLVEKPEPRLTPSNLAITGKYIITPQLLKDLEKSHSSTNDKEIRLIDGMRTHIKKNRIFGLEIKGKRFDTGNKQGYVKAVIHFASKNK